MAKILIIDLGTSSFKLALFDRAGQLCGLARQEPPLQRPVAGRLELTAKDFARTIADGVAEVEVRPVAVGCRGHQLRHADQQLPPAGRSSRTADTDHPLARPEGRGTPPEIQACTGLPALTATTGIPGLTFQFMLAKLLWLRRDEPTIWPACAGSA